VRREMVGAPHAIVVALDELLQRLDAPVVEVGRVPRDERERRRLELRLRLLVEAGPDRELGERVRHAVGVLRLRDVALRAARDLPREGPRAPLLGGVELALLAGRRDEAAAQERREARRARVEVLRLVLRHAAPAMEAEAGV